MPLPQQQIDESLQLVIDTFKEVRTELMASYGTISHTSKGDDSPVTELDVKVESLLKSRLAKKYPHIGFHGEETEDTLGTSNATWIVDPIDGTSSFIHGLPYCTNMAGLVVDNEIVASVIYLFPTDELYTARKGHGAYKNSQKITVKNTELDNSIVFTGPYVYEILHSIFDPYKIGLYAPIGASGYEYTRIAEGSIQGVTKLRSKAQIHDNVPGVLVATEAGAEVVSFDNDVYTYESLSLVTGTPNFTKVVRQHYDEIKSAIKR